MAKTITLGNPQSNNTDDIKKLTAMARTLNHVLKSFLATEIAHFKVSTNLPYLTKYAGALSRLCHASGTLDWRLKHKHITRLDCNFAEVDLYNLLISELNDVMALSKNKKYSMRLLQAITRGVNYVNAWF